MQNLGASEQRETTPAEPPVVAPPAAPEGTSPVVVPAPVVAVPPGAADDDTTGPIKDLVAAGVVATGDITKLKKGTSIPVKQYANLDEKTLDIGALQEMLAVNTEVIAAIFDEIESAAVTLKISDWARCGTRLGSALKAKLAIGNRKPNGRKLLVQRLDCCWLRRSASTKSRETS